MTPSSWSLLGLPEAEKDAGAKLTEQQVKRAFWHQMTLLDTEHFKDAVPPLQKALDHVLFLMRQKRPQKDSREAAASQSAALATVSVSQKGAIEDHLLLETCLELQNTQPGQVSRQAISEAFLELLDLAWRDEARWQKLVDLVNQQTVEQQKNIRETLLELLTVSAGFYDQPAGYRRPKGWSRAVARIVMAGWSWPESEDWQKLAVEKQDWLSPLWPKPNEETTPSQEERAYTQEILKNVAEETASLGWKTKQFTHALLIGSTALMAVIVLGLVILHHMLPDTFLPPSPEKTTAEGIDADSDAIALETAKMSVLCQGDNALYTLCRPLSDMYVRQVSIARLKQKALMVVLGHDDCADCQMLEAYLDGEVKQEIAAETHGGLPLFQEDWIEDIPLGEFIWHSFHIWRLPVSPNDPSSLEILTLASVQDHYQDDLPFLFIMTQTERPGTVIPLAEIMTGEGQKSPAGIARQPFFDALEKALKP